MGHGTSKSWFDMKMMHYQYREFVFKTTKLANRLVYDIHVQNIYSAEMYNKICNMYNKSDGHNKIKHSLCKIMNPEYKHRENISIYEYWDSTKSLKPNKYTYKKDTLEMKHSRSRHPSLDRPFVLQIL